MPPAVIGVALPCTARTATRRAQPSAPAYFTVTVVSPNVSCGPPVTRTLRTTLPLAPLIVVEPGRLTEIAFVGGTAAYEVGFASHGSWASTTRVFSTPLGVPLMK